MAVRTIPYLKKRTQAKTVYCELGADDQRWTMTKIRQILAYMGEIGIARGRELRDIRDWWTNPNKDLPFNAYMRNKNSPYSFCSGIINNCEFGNQRDLSEQQLITLQQIITVYANIVDFIQDGDLKIKQKGIKIQAKADNDQVIFKTQFFT